MLFSALTVALRHFFYSKKALIVPSNRKPPPSITVIGNPPDANRHEYPRIATNTMEVATLKILAKASVTLTGCRATRKLR